MADRFLAEALARRNEADSLELKPYLIKLLKKLEKLETETDNKQKAEDALMYSTLFQNAALTL